VALSTYQCLEDIRMTSQEPHVATRDVILSYARRDLFRAEEVARALKARGLTVWWDRKIAPGTRYEEEIERRLCAAGCVVVLWSRNSLRSDWVKDEALEAAKRKALIPAILEEGLELPLTSRGLNSASLVKWSGQVEGHEGFEGLVRAIRMKLANSVAKAVDQEEHSASARVRPQCLSLVARLTAGQPFFEKTTGMSFLWVPPGKFWMGSTKIPGEPNFDQASESAEQPVHEVILTDGFWMGEFPVTNAQYGKFLEARPATPPMTWHDPRFCALGQPVVGVNWEQSRAFVAWLTGQAQLDGSPCFDLPTEAEWEYAARGTTSRKYPWGDEPPTAERADFWKNSGLERPADVGSHPSGKSRWGIQDMAGCVWEWCLDGWQDNFYKAMANPVNPCHLPDCYADRVIRGGSWSSGPTALRCGYRHKDAPETELPNLGFRVVCRF
jgi:formylglycine-generating enzyme required for sulfatase activity